MTPPLAEVLNEALADEYKARDTYRAIIDRFGPVRPFINIVDAEQTHIDALLALFARYDIPVPPEPDPARILLPDTLLDACRQGIEAELQNVAMCDRLLAAIEKADVRMVLERLQRPRAITTCPPFDAVESVAVQCLPAAEAADLAGASEVAVDRVVAGEGLAAAVDVEG
jgi:hypothetical protein